MNCPKLTCMRKTKYFDINQKINTFYYILYYDILIFYEVIIINLSMDLHNTLPPIVHYGYI